MRIVQLTPGSGDNFYCENCLRDIALVRAMRSLGHDVVMVPLYLPLMGDKGVDLSDTPVFLGGVNIYLQQKLALFRKTPRWFDRIFDNPVVLRWAARKAGMTSARDLGETAISILQGEQGRGVKELDRLINWLSEQQKKPDAICLSNILLAGMAKCIRDRLNLPVICLLQDEDGFLDSLAEPYAGQAWEILADQAGYIDGFVAVSNYYAEVMCERLQLNVDKVKVVYTGIAVEDFKGLRSFPQIPAIGFLSRMCSAKGLDTLVNAFIKLKQKDNFQDLRLKIAGGKIGNDDEFVRKIQRRLDRADLLGEVDFLTDFDQNARISFLRTVSVLSVPEKYSVAYGLYVLEALACGVPVVEPARGVFPELAKKTGGVLLYEDDDANALADSLEKVLVDEDLAKQLGNQGRKSVFEQFDIEKNAAEMIAVFEKFTGTS